MSSDRFHVIPAEMIPPPGYCFICGYDKRPVVDFGVEIDYVGAFLICLECLHDVVNIDELQLMSKHEALKIMEENTYLKQQQLLVSGKLGELQNALVASLDDYVRGIHNITAESVVPPETSGDLL